MARYENSYELNDVDYESITKRKEIQPPSSRKIIYSTMRGNTLVTRVIDKNFQRLVISGRYGGAIE